MMERGQAVDRVLEVLDTIESEPTPVPIREVWVLGDLALGLDPVERIDLYVAKDLLFASEAAEEGHHAPDREPEFRERYGVAGIGKSVSAAWAEAFPDRIAANDHGHAAPEQCLATHLIRDGDPIHLEICNAGFEQNVVQRVRAAADRERYAEVLDPRGVCLWQDGTRSETAPEKLRAGEYVFPPLAEALAALGLSEDQATEAAAAIREWRSNSTGATVRSDVV